MMTPVQDAAPALIVRRTLTLMVRGRSCAVSNHEDNRRILRDAAKRPLLRMRIVFVARVM
jgi:hypothetical protein